MNKKLDILLDTKTSQNPSIKSKTIAIKEGQSLFDQLMNDTKKTLSSSPSSKENSSAALVKKSQTINTTTSENKAQSTKNTSPSSLLDKLILETKENMKATSENKEGLRNNKNTNEKVSPEKKDENSLKTSNNIKTLNKETLKPLDINTNNKSEEKANTNHESIKENKLNLNKEGNPKPLIDKNILEKTEEKNINNLNSLDSNTNKSSKTKDSSLLEKEENLVDKKIDKQNSGLNNKILNAENDKEISTETKKEKNPFLQRIKEVKTVNLDLKDSSLNSLVSKDIKNEEKLEDKKNIIQTVLDKENKSEKSIDKTQSEEIKDVKAVLLEENEKLTSFKNENSIKKDETNNKSTKNISLNQTNTMQENKVSNNAFNRTVKEETPLKDSIVAKNENTILKDVKNTAKAEITQEKTKEVLDSSKKEVNKENIISLNKENNSPLNKENNTSDTSSDNKAAQAFNKINNNLPLEKVAITKNDLLNKEENKSLEKKDQKDIDLEKTSENKSDKDINITNKTQKNNLLNNIYLSSQQRVQSRQELEKVSEIKKNITSEKSMKSIESAASDLKLDLKDSKIETKRVQKTQNQYKGLNKETILERLAFSKNILKTNIENILGSVNASVIENELSDLPDQTLNVASINITNFETRIITAHQNTSSMMSDIAKKMYENYKPPVTAFRMLLNPSTLGSISIIMKSDKENGLSISLNMSNQNTLETMTENHNTLRSALAKNFSEDSAFSLDFNMQGDNNNSSANNGENKKQQNNSTNDILESLSNNLNPDSEETTQNYM